MLSDRSPRAGSPPQPRALPLRLAPFSDCSSARSTARRRLRPPPAWATRPSSREPPPPHIPSDAPPASQDAAARQLPRCHQFPTGPPSGGRAGIVPSGHRVPAARCPLPPTLRSTPLRGRTLWHFAAASVSICEHMSKQVTFAEPLHVNKYVKYL